MHILVAALHRPEQPTGVCRHAANLARCLADTGAVSQITLVVGAWQMHYFKRAFSLDSEKIKLVNVDIENNSVSRNLWFLFGLPKLANALRPDVIHLSFPLPFVRSQFSCPVVSTIHDLYPYECPGNFGYFRSFFNRWFLRQCIQESDGLACVSQITLNRLTEFFTKITLQKKLAVIYNYIDFKNVSSQPPKYIGESAESPFILSVAQHRKNKNLDVLIDVYCSLLNNRQLDNSTKLIIVGSSGPETENLRRQIQSHALQDLIFLISSVEDAQLCWLYQHCELFVIPSSTEGFCIPLVEALNFSCKVVCSDIPIFREIAGSRCHYFGLTDKPVESLAQAIVQPLQQLPADDEFNESRFAKANIAKQYLDFYAKVLDY